MSQGLTPARLLLRFVIFILGAALLALFLTYYKPFHEPKPLPVLGSVESFSFTERSGKPITDAALRGKISVVDFIFTACPGPCFHLSTNFSAFQKEILPLDGVQLVSFSVDPENDTPATLSKYADRFSADPQRWLFVTGDKAKLYHLIENSFKLAVQQNYDPNAAPEDKFIHSTRLVLVDAGGSIRGYYDGLNPETYPKLKADIEHLLR